MSMKQGFGLVRDADGRPRIDDPSQTHPAILVLLPPEERRAMNLWDGPLVSTAQGTRRAEIRDDGVYAKDALVAAREVFIDADTYYSLNPRRDIPAGAKIPT